MADSSFDELMPGEDDLLYEEELLRNPYVLKLWVRYLDARKDAPTKKRNLLYERAVKALPGSYKVRTRGLLPGTSGRRVLSGICSRQSTFDVIMGGFCEIVNDITCA